MTAAATSWIEEAAPEDAATWKAFLAVIAAAQREAARSRDITPIIKLDFSSLRLVPLRRSPRRVARPRPKRKSGSRLRARRPARRHGRGRTAKRRIESAAGPDGDGDGPSQAPQLVGSSPPSCPAISGSYEVHRG